MEGMGGPKFRGDGKGDQYVRIIIEIPKKLTKEQKEIWTKIHEIKDVKPGFFDGLFS